MFRLIFILMLLLSPLGYSSESGAREGISNEAQLNTFIIPVSEDAKVLLSKMLKHHSEGEDEALTEFFKRQGVAFPEGSSSELDVKKNLITVTNSHFNSSLVVAITGDIILKVVNRTPEADLWKRYFQDEVEHGCGFAAADKPDKNKGEQGCTDQPTTAE
ncbi:hypothetical protein [Persicirhabdus sediminis]|uniref:Uncharacterized protein n=1 Tax=Persicirhabdus sediminis TaxID=454144 RepID=A0A8J7MFP8_9BACT|nr:hypothetical protein [Persicirhabdus sediminis]MBK1792347.1 hypothetical protein [Persicirhabdus sediminis]